jgi:L-alanine-DL-glutamate epimerase-like enolase superfamily enzyme
MKITSVASTIVDLPFDMGGPKPPFAGRPWDCLEILLVRVETDDGLVGWGGERADHALAWRFRSPHHSCGEPPLRALSRYEPLAEGDQLA